MLLKIQYSISFNLRSILSIYGLPKSFVHTHTHLNNIKRGKILYSNKKHWKESLVPNLHRLALKLQLYQGGTFLCDKRETATLSLSLSLHYFSVGILPLPPCKREIISDYILLRGIIVTSEAYRFRWLNYIVTKFDTQLLFPIIGKQINKNFILNK